jgi:hypothetical protein
MVHAIQARATIDRRACATHLPLLLYVAFLTALLGLFASIVYGQMQPTVIPNAGFVGDKAPGPANLFLDKLGTYTEEMERAAVDAAEKENRDQGIEPLAAFAAVEPAVEESRPPHTNTASAPRAKRANPKPKRVAKQDTVADPWRSTWNAPWQRGHGRRWNSNSGRSGSRPLWASGERF